MSEAPEDFETKFQEALEKLKEGVKEGENVVILQPADAKIILEGFSTVCQQRNMAQEVIKNMDTSPVSEAAYLAAALDKALDTIQKITCGKRR